MAWSFGKLLKVYEHGLQALLGWWVSKERGNGSWRMGLGGVATEEEDRMDFEELVVRRQPRGL